MEEKKQREHNSTEIQEQSLESYTSSNRRIAKNAMMLYIRMFFTMVIGLITSRIVLQTLGVNDYGIFNLVAGIVVLMNMFTSSLSSATSRFLTYCLGENNMDKLSTTFSTAFFIHLLLSVSVLVIGETVGLWFINTHLVIAKDRMIAANFAYQAALISTVLSITQTPYNASIISHERIHVFAYITILFNVLKLLIALSLLFFGKDKLILYSILNAIISIIIMLIYRIYCLRNFKESHFKFIFNTKLFKSMLSFSGWSLFAKVGETSCKQGVNIILNRFFGTAINAASGVALQVQAVLYGFISNITTAFIPQLIKEFAISNLSRVNYLIFLGTKITSVLTLLVSIPVAVNIDFLMKLWLGDVPKHASSICVILLVHNFINSFHPMIIYSINATGKIRGRCLFAGLVYLVNIIIAYIIVSVFRSAPYVYWIFPMNSLLILLYILNNLKKVMPDFQLSLFVKCILLRIMAIGMLTYFLCSFLANQINSSIHILCISSLIAIVFISILVYSFVFNVNEKRVLISKLKNIRYR